MDRRIDAAGAMPRPQTWSQTRRGPTAESRVSIARLSHNSRPSSGGPEFGAQLVSFNFPNPLICVVGSSSVCTYGVRAPRGPGECTLATPCLGDDRADLQESK